MQSLKKLFILVLPLSVELVLGQGEAVPSTSLQVVTKVKT